jgi:hypothetical protein
VTIKEFLVWLPPYPTVPRVDDVTAARIKEAIKDILIHIPEGTAQEKRHIYIKIGMLLERL